MLSKQSIRRMLNAGLSDAWSAWLELWEEQVAQRQMLASAGARLLRPKLAASLAKWRDDWQSEKMGSMLSAQELLPSLQRLAAEQKEQLEEVRAQLAAATKAQRDADRQVKALLAAGAEGERAAAIREEREKAARVEALASKAGARIKNQGIMRGWSAWQELWEERVTERQMLAAAGGRLLKPKLAASLAHWRHDWETTAGIQGESDAESRLAVEREANAALEAEVQRRVAERKALNQEGVEFEAFLSWYWETQCC